MKRKPATDKKPARGSRRAEIKPIEPPSPDNSTPNFLVAAIGASAGGVEAFTELVRHLPTDTGMAFVLIQHLDPKHQSILTELVGRETHMPVREVSDGMRMEPDHVYVIPPNTSMSLSDHALKLGPREEVRGGHMPIDRFMRSLAEGQGNRAIGVILSGSGTDGTLGMAEIQAHGGVTFAQDETAKYDGMPRSAVAAGCVDYILPPKGIARELARVAAHPYVARTGPEAEETAAPESALSTIFQALRRSTGVDFSHYRKTTVLRRIERRMVVHKIEELEDYVKHLQNNPSEIKALYQDMLINVTSFFRNADLFDAMKSQVFPALMKNREEGVAIRIWTPACASGEETYSIAMALLEFLGDKGAQMPIQIFGTDVSESSILKARTAAYPENVQGDVSPERLRRFFTRSDGGYRVSKSVRDMCIFAQHNVLSDPPFSQMDVVCCRNLLIYLEPGLQNKVLSLFHYATRPNGFLILGSSEGVGSASSLFALQDRAHKIFSKRATTARPVVTFALNYPHGLGGPETSPSISKPADSSWNYLEAQKEFDRRLLTQYSPAAVFINEDGEIIHTRGNVNRYLKLAPGRASLNILRMSREELLIDLRNAISRAKKEKETIRKTNVALKSGSGAGVENGGAVRLVNFEVVPLQIGESKEPYLMVLFQDAPAETTAKSRSGHNRSMKRELRQDAMRVVRLEQELAATKEHLQSVIETQEATNGELQSANEEILSSNEELQSTNEELETAKEELQSANEELSTVNDELRSRNSEITEINNDLINLLSSIDITVVMLDSELKIRRFTPRAEKLLGLIAGDVGRPFLNITPTVDLSGLQSMVREVLSSGEPLEKRVSDARGQRYQLRVLPYRMTDGKIDGAVVTVVDLNVPDLKADEKSESAS